MPLEFQDHLFDRFTQADSSDVRQQGGTGLGLNISQAIIESHGGVIGFESEPGNGATFYFDLVEYGEDLAAMPAPAQPQVPTGQPKILDRQNILVIEDDPDVAEFITIMLRQYGARCDVAHDTGEARRKFAERPIRR